LHHTDDVKASFKTMAVRTGMPWAPAHTQALPAATLNAIKDMAVDFTNMGYRDSYSGQTVLIWLFTRKTSVCLATIALLLCGIPARAQQPAPASHSQSSLPSTGTIVGTVSDSTGAPVAGACITLAREDHSPNQDVLSDENGRFTFTGIAPGNFQLTVASAGFASQGTSGTLHSGENYVIPPVALALASTMTEIRVALSRTEVAEAEIKDEEKQRILGFVPNFYVSYVSDAAPLTTKQKFELAWKSTIDPVNFAITGAIAGIEQSQNAFSGYGQGAQGYGKRFGANYADGVTSVFIGSAILPSLLKQDPRYFYKGTGSRHSRVLYALANSVICKGDNGHWQPNYSSILGGLAAGGISNLYYPEKDRNGVDLTFENALIGIGATAAANVLQEFVIRKLTPKVPNYAPAKP
jgi:Carboxypeptidase regulatory-like domain